MVGRIVGQTFDEIRDSAKRGMCSACGQPDAVPKRICVAENQSLEDLDDYVPKVPLCPSCINQHEEAHSRLHLGLSLIVPLPLLIALISIVTMPFKPVFSPILAYMFAVLISLAIFKNLRRSAAKQMPLLVIGGKGQEVLFLSAPNHMDSAIPISGQGPYRQNQPLSPRKTKLNGPLSVAAGTSSLFMSLLVGGASMIYIYPQCYPQVMLDNWSSETVKVNIDDSETIVLPPGSDEVVRLRYGTHHFSVFNNDRQLTSLDEFNRRLPWGTNQTLGIPAKKCDDSMDSLPRAHVFPVVHRIDRKTADGRWIQLFDPIADRIIECTDDSSGFLEHL